MTKRHKNKKLATIAILLLLISVGFAYLTATLEIAGLAGVKKNTWKIYFDNVEIYKGESLATTAPTTTGTDTTDLEYSVTLSKPGDKYKFFVDIVNEGSLNAMVNVVKVTDLTADQKKYLNYTVTYADETPIDQLYLLAKKTGDTPTRDTIVVTIEYKKDIIEEDLPNEDFTLTEKLHLDYHQANKSDIVRPTTKPKITFNWNYNYVRNGDFTDGTDNWNIIKSGTTATIDKEITYNGKPSLHVYTGTSAYEGIINVIDGFNNYPYPANHTYLFHLCAYKDSTNEHGDVNEHLRYFFVYNDESDKTKYLGISTGDDILKESLVDKQWVCLDKLETLPESVNVNSPIAINNANSNLTNNYWLADVSLKIVDKKEYDYNSQIGELPVPTVNGYTFDGWYTDPYGGEKIETTTLVRESATYYAHWSKIST